MIYFGRRYTATARGSVVKGAYCQNCGNDYFYMMECTAQGQGSSPYYLDNAGAERRAEQAAQKHLATKLRGILAVRCPDCGFYQPDMLRLLRKRRWYRVVFWLAILALAVAGVAFLSAGISAFAGYTLLAGASLLGLWWAVRSTDDPNAIAHQAVSKADGAWRRSEMMEQMRAMSPSQQETLSKALAELDQRRQALWRPARQTSPVEQQAAESQRSAQRRIRLAGWLAATVAVGYALGPAVARYEEEATYRAAKGQGLRLDVFAAERYLKQYPNGRHVAELAGLRDDLAFRQATLAAQRRCDPSLALAYLKTPTYSRHRDETQKLLAGVYDAAAAELAKKRSDAKQGALARVLLATLGRRAATSAPVLTVAIRGQHVAQPTGATRTTEAADVARTCAASLGLEAFCSKRAPAVVLIPPPSAFAQQAILAREKTLLARLDSLVQGLCGRNTLTLQRASASHASADLLLEYRVAPTGSVSVWSRTTGTRGPRRPASVKATEEVVALIRDFELRGVLRAAGQAKPLAEFAGSPREGVQFDVPSRDPAISAHSAYRSLLMSATFEAGAALERAFGLEPRQTPKKFAEDGNAR